MRAFWIALQFLTRLPTPALTGLAPRDTGRSVLFYPLAGLVIGALLCGLDIILRGSDPGVHAALLLLAWTGLTGGLHLDGLADSADAWVGGHGDRLRTLEIMKDPRSGPAAVTLVVLVLILKYAALTALVRHSSWMMLLIAPVLGRTALVFLFITTAYVRKEGLGAMHANQLPRIAAISVVALVCAAVMILLGWNGLLVLVVTTGGVYLLRHLMIARIGGMTGDTLGASCEITEALTLITCALLLAGRA
jgi:adenosylcobinamide-GDP ribazoletransferase